MMKIKTAFLLIIASFPLRMNAQAFAFDFSAVAPSGQTLYYEILDSNTVGLTAPYIISHSGWDDFTWYDFTEPAGALVIPDSVSHNGTTYAVTAIGNSVFIRCHDLTTITIPNTVTTIGGAAFFHCSGLDSVIIPSSVTSIGERAFLGCSGLTSVIIPNSVTSIGDDIFMYCEGLAHPVYNNTLFVFLPQSYSGAYEIPEGITTICGGAFNNCAGLISVSIPNTVTSIGIEAFYNCSGLTSVTIPNTINFIGDAAFRGCIGLTQPIYNNTLFACLPHYFSGSYSIPDGINTICGFAFYDCNNLVSVTIPNTVTTIGNGAFAYCRNLALATIPNSVTSIGYCCFEGCEFLTSVNIPNSIISIEQGTFQSCTGLTSVTLPNSVTSIGARAFYRCSGLTSVIIPNSVASIDEEAFCGCSGLSTVKMRTLNPPNCHTSYSGVNVFSGIAENAVLYVPCGRLTAYSDWQTDCFPVSLREEEPYEVVATANYPERGYVTSHVDCATGAELTATAYSGYQFVRWSNGVTYNPYSFAVTGDMEITAIFESVGTIFNVTATAADPAQGSVSGGGPYAVGTEAVLTAIPAQGFAFDHWNDGQTDNPRTITVTQDTAFVAYFVSTQGIADVADENFIVYPNPTSGIVQIAGDEVLSLEVIDQQGRILLQSYVPHVDLSAQPSGIYLLRITTENGVAMWRIVKQ